MFLQQAFTMNQIKGHKDKVKCRYENQPKNAAITGSD
jgi:hypothetical protein